MEDDDVAVVEKEEERMMVMVVVVVVANRRGCTRRMLERHKPGVSLFFFIDLFIFILI